MMHIASFIRLSYIRVFTVPYSYGTVPYAYWTGFVVHVAIRVYRTTDAMQYWTVPYIHAGMGQSHA